MSYQDTRWRNLPRCEDAVCVFYSLSWLIEANPCLAVYFAWFALLRHRRFDDRPLFKPGAFWFADILDRLKTNIFARWNNFCNKPISHNMGKILKEPPPQKKKQIKTNTTNKKQKITLLFLNNFIYLFFEWSSFI